MTTLNHVLNVRMNSQLSSPVIVEIVNAKIYPPPLLFAIYLNDLESFLLSGGIDTIDLEILSQKSINYVELIILLYADDTKIFSCDKVNYQKALDNLQ